MEAIGEGFYKNFIKLLEVRVCSGRDHAISQETL
jgi:hypothetical protein